jgi:hypothetical protein
LQGFEYLKHEDAQLDFLNLFKEFSDRMQKRIERDITPAVDKKTLEALKNKSSKKRKFAEAFPDLNSSLDSTGS